MSLIVTWDMGNEDPLTIDDPWAEVESVEEAGKLAAELELDGTVYDEAGFVRGHVKASGDWRAQ